MTKDHDRLILHCDCNNFFASCECLERPELKDVPMAVAGDPANRTGIVVAKNEIAKKYGVKTTDTVWKAKMKCPEIVFVPPRHKLYEQISAKVNAIYTRYTDYVEPASIDESYLDMTGVPALFEVTPEQLADMLRARIREEIGITISVGVSFNKAFAKMGSDYKKPDATTVITEDNFKAILWPLPVTELLFVGKADAEVLKRNRINTIGDLARLERQELIRLLGKGGGQLWDHVNGLDQEPVCMFGDQPEVKSVSRGMTLKRDLITESEIHTGLAVLADEVATALREQVLKGSTIQVHIKTPTLKTVSRQTTLRHHTYLQHEILNEAKRLVMEHWFIGSASPIRALTVGVTNLIASEDATEQINLFDAGLLEDGDRQESDRDRRERLENAIDELRKKHGEGIISLGYPENEDIGIGRRESRK